jgi:valyl-tRNA synthetase
MAPNMTQNTPTLETLEKAYEPKDIEAKWYPRWQEAGVFQAHAPSKPGEKTFTIVMPPPNITGSLHMGHALTATIEDTLVRWHRMKGDNTLWVPGTDHAGIATQMVVERELKKEGKSRHDLGRDAFVKRVWQWKEQYGSRINEQHRALGASCDWSRENFTMSDKLNRAVREVFVRLYEEGLMYRDERLINWCPQCMTALSDLEVEHEEGKKGSLWHIRYPVVDQPGRFVVVATTRPETLLGDTAVAVHSADARYQDLHGKRLVVPLTGRDIPIIVDDVLVDPEFGSGAVKVTPAHDFNDFQTGKRHSLPMIAVLDKAAKINLPGSPFQGLDRFAARKAIVAALQEQGLLERIEDHTLSVGMCQRSQTVVEPYLSTQWYVRMKTLAEPALEAVTSGKTKILPEYWTKTYEHWMTNIQDWCVSRQLWWGHQIPAYYCETCNDEKPYVSRQALTQCPSCKGTKMYQDPDVLDTWFSSGLWPFSTLGWPEKTADSATFYPNNVMETGSDILFFWVARMMMFGIHFMGKPPFETIYLHSMVRDDQGQKMSKTKGNVIDPLDIVFGVDKDNLGRLPKSAQKSYAEGLPAIGADALRFTLATMSAAGRDIKLSFEAMQGYRAFCNKLWNATRFALMNLEGYTPGAFGAERKVPEGATMADRWIRGRLDRTIGIVEKALSEFQFSDASLAIYHFVWNEFCDWYLELAKPPLRDQTTPAEKRAAQDTLVYVLDQVLRLLHPFMPYITEELWHALPRDKGDEKLLAKAAYPVSTGVADAQVERDVAVLIDAITAIRNIRGENKLAPSKQFPAELHGDAEALALLQPLLLHVERLAMVSPVALRPSGSAKPSHAATSVVGKVEGVVSLEGLIDWSKERERLTRDVSKLRLELERVEKKLGTASFVERAPAEVLAKEKEKAAEIGAQIAKIDASLAQIPA